MSTLNTCQIKEKIPHRAPILLVDAVTDYTLGESITATRYLPEGDPAFKGHFPGHPILPGVLGVEALAQTSALLVNLTAGTNADNAMFYFMGIEKVKFKTPIHPGDTLTLTVNQEKKLRDIYRFNGTVTKEEDGKTVTCTTAIFTAKHFAISEEQS